MVPDKQIRHVIPINAWNKRTKGQERGKTPVHEDWVVRNYGTTPKLIDKWLKNGSNIGYRVPKNGMVVDIDPRNGASRKRRLELAELFGYKSFKQFLKATYSTKTGGGGWHLYFKLPKGIKYKRLVEHHEDFKGVEFKKYGRQCLLAPSRHPDGPHYEELTNKKFATVPKLVLKVLKREIHEGNTVGGGEFTPLALSELLEHLPPDEYDTNDKWEPLLMAAHHATGGVGIEEFVEWSRQDPSFDSVDNELMIRRRWDSCDVNRKDGRTYKSLCYELELRGEDAKGFRARAEFQDIDNDSDVDEEVEEPDDADEEREKGQQLESDAHMINTSTPTSELTAFMRRSNAIGGPSSIMADKIAQTNSILSMREYAKMKKDIQHKTIEDLPRKLAEYTLAHRYADGNNLMVLKNGSTWVYRATHWVNISEEYLRGDVLRELDKNYRTLVGDDSTSQNALVRAAADLLKMRAAAADNVLIEDKRKLSVINCRNGELWLTPEGKTRLKKHKAGSYLINVLPIAYDANATCTVWEKRLSEIFEGDKEMIRHLQEIFGYMLQPDKNLHGWFLFRGQGGDGKSSILEVLGAVMGDAMHRATPALLGLDNSHATAGLVGKLCVAIEELSVKNRLPDSTVKMLANKSVMEANPKGKDVFNFDYVAGLVMCCNGWPRVDDLSEGMKRRANIIPFNRSFTKTGDDKIEISKEIIENELAGVLAWSLRGLRRLRKRGRFKKPKKCVQATAMWFSKSHMVSAWLGEVKKKAKRGDYVTLKDSYIHFVSWCQLQGIERKPNKTDFAEDLRALGFKIGRYTGNKVCVFDLKLSQLEE